MRTIPKPIATAILAYRRAEARGDMNELATATIQLYEALGQPLGSGLAWIWYSFGTWTTKN